MVTDTYTACSFWRNQRYSPVARIKFIVYHNYMNRSDKFRIKKYQVLSPKIKTPVRIAQVSDLHEKEFGENNRFLFEAVEGLKPDMIVITGDMVYDTYTKQPNDAYIGNVAAWAPKVAPSFFVTGNHERIWPEYVKDIFVQNGVTVLENCFAAFTKGDTIIDVGGVEDPTVDKRGYEKLRFPDDDRFHLLLAHDPAPFSFGYTQTGADLILCGHTHGGQIRFPGGKAIVSPGDHRPFPKYSDGLYTNGKIQMIISMGLGVSVIPFRMFTPREVLLIHLLPENNKRKDDK